MVHVVALVNLLHLNEIGCRVMVCDDALPGFWGCNAISLSYALAEAGIECRIWLFHPW
jgi:hypothetical protein